eukprot:TRINITY_DN23012_c0_g1_i1.p1 TRINITY_DN23012_c0_g1~~TRINITY_DN23012_c0_g1_i1.p1  ORF type:complete len:419 (+),score=131.40 TRINITY_DN23012_c0_g1_i1:85-1257(+)
MPSVVGFLQSLIAVGATAAALLRMLGWWLRDKQGALLYHPDQPPDSRRLVALPEDHGMPHYERFDVRTTDGLTLRSYFIHGPRQGGQQPAPLTVIHFHGNAGNIGHRLPLARRLQSALGCNVVLAEYRGYGASDSPEHITEHGLKLDAQATLDHVRALPYVDPMGVVLYGASLGGAVAIDLAAKPENERKIAGLIIENSFTSISDMVDVLFRSLLDHHSTLTPHRKTVVRWVFLHLFKPLILWIGWRSVDLMPRLRLPVLLVSGEGDELIPPEQMHRLYAGCRAAVKRLESIPQGSHNDTWVRPAFLPVVQRFVFEHVLPQTDRGSAAGIAGDPEASPPSAAEMRDARGGLRAAGANSAHQQVELAAWGRGGTLLRPFVAGKTPHGGLPV